MTDRKSDSSARLPTRAKRPYKAPRVLSRERLEAIAAVCTPTGKADPGSCPAGPIGS